MTATPVVEAAATMVKRVVAVFPFRVTDGGEKLQVAFDGRPEQAKEMVPLNPYAGATVSVVVPDEPSVTSIVAGLSVTAKSGWGATTVMVSAGEVEAL